jgi:hypothetical protein
MHVLGVFRSDTIWYMWPPAQPAAATQSNEMHTQQAVACSQEPVLRSGNRQVACRSRQAVLLAAAGLFRIPNLSHTQPQAGQGVTSNKRTAGMQGCLNSLPGRPAGQHPEGVLPQLLTSQHHQHIMSGGAATAAQQHQQEHIVKRSLRYCCSV